MLIEALLTIVHLLFSVLLGAIDLAALPVNFISFMAEFLRWIITGIAFCNSFIHTTYIYSLLSFLLLLNAGVWAYHVIMWIFKKIPFINIK